MLLKNEKYKFLIFFNKNKLSESKRCRFLYFKINKMCDCIHNSVNHDGVSHNHPISKKHFVKREFIWCKFDDKCTDIACPYFHPRNECKFGKRCTRPDCPYFHPHKHYCALGNKCTNKHCRFLHPREVDCKYGDNCTDPKCSYRHKGRIPCKYGAKCRNPKCQYFHHVADVIQYVPVRVPVGYVGHPGAKPVGKQDGKPVPQQSSKSAVGKPAPRPVAKSASK